MNGYCMRCKEKVEMKDPQTITMKNGRPATQGVCPKCGSKVFRIGLVPPEGPEFLIRKRVS